LPTLLTMKSALVVGAGVTGCSAALELARRGSSVTVLEQSSRIGGKVLSYCCKATDSCSRCGVCIAHDTIAEAIRHPKIRFLPNATLESVDASGARVAVKAAVRGARIDLRACIDCGKCLTACPQRAISRYSRAGLVQYAVDVSACRAAAGQECDLCAKVCPVDAIDLPKSSSAVRVAADGVLVATGHANFDPVIKPRLGYRRLPNVMTGFEAEQVLAGELDLGGGSGRSVAFIQCVGSRDPSLCRNFCSAVCCSYALRMARVLKTRNPQADVTVYYIDIQHFDKVQSAFRADVERSGVKLVRGIPSSVSPSGGRLALAIDDPATGAITAMHDTVVLSAGMQPADGADEVAARFGLGRDAFGFFDAAAGGDAAGRILAAGTCVEPQDLFSAMSAGRAAALELEGAAR
jgi:heterodisulfide reductase subunit A2